MFLKTWFQVELPKFYNPVTNLLMAPERREEWKGMKTVGMLRKEMGAKAPFSKDSQYQKVRLILGLWRISGNSDLQLKRR